MGLGAGCDVGGDAAQGVGDVLERPRSRAQRIQGLKRFGLFQIDIETTMDTCIITRIADETTNNRRIPIILNRNALTIHILPPATQRGKNVRVKRGELKWR